MKSTRRLGLGYVTSGAFTALCVAVFANLDGMIQLFEKFKEMEKGRKNTFLDQLLASHPPTDDRIAKVKEHIRSFNLAGKKLAFGEEEYQNIKSRLP